MTTAMSQLQSTSNTAPTRALGLTVNGEARSLVCEDRELLLDVLRTRLGLTGTHAGCRNGDCGACTVEVNGQISEKPSPDIRYHM